jgi:hypothetical protein
MYNFESLLYQYYKSEGDSTIAKVHGFQNFAGGRSNCGRKLEQRNIWWGIMRIWISGNGCAPERSE